MWEVLEARLPEASCCLRQLFSRFQVEIKPRQIMILDSRHLLIIICQVGAVREGYRTYGHLSGVMTYWGSVVIVIGACVSAIPNRDNYSTQSALPQSVTERRQDIGVRAFG